jgi:acetyl-CoA C-acetyltransferase
LESKACKGLRKGVKMGSIKDKVAIIGMGCTNFGELWDKTQDDLMIEACYEAFEDAGVEPKDIEAAWLGTVVGGNMGVRLGRALKLEYIPITRIENICSTGTDTFRNACYSVAAGIYDIVLACGVEKLKDSGYRGRPIPPEPDDSSKVEIKLLPASLFAQLATRYFETYGLGFDYGRKLLAKIAVKNHHNGTMNPKAQFQREITEEQVLNAPIVSYPLGVFDACGITDGAAAAIITTPEIAKKFRDDYIVVKGLGLVAGSQQGTFQTDYDFSHVEENYRAAQAAYKEAGIKDPRNEIDLAIVHDCFTIHELTLYEDLGFSPRGKAKDDIEAGTFALDGELPVNTDGGLKCFGHPTAATGIRTIYEVYKQIQGKAGPRQIKKADVGLTHTYGGTMGCGGVGAVGIFGRP